MELKINQSLQINNVTKTILRSRKWNHILQIENILKTGILTNGQCNQIDNSAWKHKKQHS